MFCVSRHDLPPSSVGVCRSNRSSFFVSRAVCVAVWLQSHAIISKIIEDTNCTMEVQNLKGKIAIALLLFAMVSTILLASSSATLHNAGFGRITVFNNGVLSLSDPAHINGTVTDAVTTLPINDVNVTANGVSDTTDANGHYNLEIAPGNYTVTAKKAGYTSQSMNATVAVNQTITVNFALSTTPVQTGWIAGNVTDASTHTAIDSAVIMAGNKSTETNSTGLYKIQLAPGTYNVTASKNGYMNQTKTGIIVKAGNVTAIDFALVKVPPIQSKAVVVINPRALNLKSHGRWISVSVELPKGLSAKDINISSIRLNDTIPVDLTAPMEISNSSLILKFSRAAVETLVLQKLAEPGKFGSVTLTITCKLKDGAAVTGSDTIKTIFNAPKKQTEMHATIF